MDDSAVRDIFKDGFDKIPIKTLILYVILLIISLVIIANDIYLGRIDQLVLSIPISAMLLIAIVSDRKIAHVPPLIILLMMVTLLFVVISSEYRDVHDFIDILSSLLTGVCLMMMGQVVVFEALHASPDWPMAKKSFIYAASFCIAMTVLLVMFLSESVYYHLHDYSGFELWVMTQYVILAMCGALVTAFLSDLGLDRFVIDSSINKSLEIDTAYSNDYAKEEALRIIQSGESEKLEFKSTITTNIRTGENDKRMEKAVLKTIVAFLNTSGGILMIGVSDDGSIYGVDESAFDSRDKMNLHLTHMISARIGDQFFPYISFRTIDMDDGKAIIRVDCSKCKKPVFLTDGKVEEFYVRSGPSSIELTGSNLVNYITNKSSKDRQSMLIGMRDIQSEE